MTQTVTFQPCFGKYMIVVNGVQRGFFTKTKKSYSRVGTSVSSFSVFIDGSRVDVPITVTTQAQVKQFVKQQF